MRQTAIHYSIATSRRRTRFPLPERRSLGSVPPPQPPPPCVHRRVYVSSWALFTHTHTHTRMRINFITLELPRVCVRFLLYFKRPRFACSSSSSAAPASLPIVSARRRCLYPSRRTSTMTTAAALAAMCPPTSPLHGDTVDSIPISIFIFVVHLPRDKRSTAVRCYNTVD